ncbi:ras GTPase-activating protein-binding protein 2 [Plodia interpunctella]|uniref:ras GTPase-activating protein-binding protein 2 n=1 Tax=Plodia interpunctella TaxID=58824 RepID=UPI002367665F|nr:ras GTPase-activating protein-binding protein 2 [Plodia interpunctella]
MVMEASPSPQSVGREFVRQYYTLLNKAPAHLHRFYNNSSSFVHGGLDAPNRETLPVVGQKQIHNRIQQLNFRDCHAKISQVDAQATLGNGVVVQVTGELSNGGAPMRRFTQTFVLAAQTPKKYYVHNDIFRYQDIVFSDEEGSGSGRSEGEEEESAGGAGFFPPPPASAAFPPAAAFVAPPPPPPQPQPQPQQPPQPQPQPHQMPAEAADATPSPAPHLNGHPPDDRQLQSNVAAAPAPEAEPEAARDSPPPAAAATTAASVPEPKTYANLLKSGAAAPRPEPPTRRPHPAHPTHVAHAPPAPAATESAATSGAGGRRYSDSQQLFLGNLPHSATEEQLRALFAQFGVVAELRVHSKPAPAGAPRHPNYGFITYDSVQAARHCLQAQPLYFPSDSADGVKLNVEEKKTRGREQRRRPLSSQRAFPRQPYRR